MTAAPTGRSRGSSRLSAIVGMVLITAVLVGVTLIVVGLCGNRSTPGRPVVAAEPVDPPAPSAAHPAVPATVSTAPRTDTRIPAAGPPQVDREAAAPTRLLIPWIGVDAAVDPLATAADGSLEPPPAGKSLAGGPTARRPGEQGPAVLAGHVDSTRRPAVFYRLGALRPGDQVTVVRQDATRASFTVNQIGEYPKDRFPTSRVYGPTPEASLRLVTCGGPFSQHTGRYQDNVIVYAVRTA